MIIIMEKKFESRMLCDNYLDNVLLLIYIYKFESNLHNNVPFNIQYNVTLHIFGRYILSADTPLFICYSFLLCCRVQKLYGKNGVSVFGGCFELRAYC